MDPFDRMFGDTIQHLAQIVLRIEAIQLGGLSQRVDRSRPVTTRVGPGEQPVLPPMQISA